MVSGPEITDLCKKISLHPTGSLRNGGKEATKIYPPTHADKHPSNDKEGLGEYKEEILVEGVATISTEEDKRDAYEIDDAVSLTTNHVITADVGEYNYAAGNIAGQGSSDAVCTVSSLHYGEDRTGLIAEELFITEEYSSSLGDVDPTQLVLPDVQRDSAGNYTCRGSNIAGEGPVSEHEILEVYYLPGEATIAQDNEHTIKGGSSVLTCLVEDLGHPEVVEFL